MLTFSRYNVAFRPNGPIYLAVQVHWPRSYATCFSSVRHTGNALAEFAGVSASSSDELACCNFSSKYFK